MNGLKAQAGELVMVNETSEDKLANLLSIENLDSVAKLVSIAKRLNELGLLDLINDLLNDEDFIKELFNQLLTTDNVMLLANLENLVRLLVKLSDKRTVENTIKLIELIDAMGSSGLAESLGAFLSNEDNAKVINNILLNPALRNLLKSLSESLNMIQGIRLDKAMEAAVEASKASESVSTVGLIRRLMTDADVKRGLLFIIGLLEGVGRQLNQIG
ncbi:DUF1641 domain-containing protein [Caldivirga sp. UBA161]|uniref:DUF1641 domain-containing protein n=1 Tax=Caldivirga sp. UBA161 TaxID=1915569 RepID=UPI0025C6B8E7|nr:DUF1641 domain-containing protein [Caldivirga sp. UBA161]